ncbi:MAG: hypothetical protein IJ433_05160 [Ruminococcus sp.]|nr:hypothetical protein [Ruminococcus sp.]
MKNFSKLLAVILCMVIALSTSACSLKPQYSYKTDDTELAIGVYIYALYSAYSQAESLAKETEGYDEEAGTYDGEKSFLKVQITDEDGVTATADEWIVNEADKSLKNLLAIEHEYNRLGATMDEATVEGYKTSAKEYWDYGPYYAMYGEQYKSPYSDIFEPLGVSYESFEYFYITSAKQEVVFDLLYADGGEKGVNDEELTKYFTDNYTNYTYFNTNMYETKEATSDEAGGAISENVAMSKDDVKKIEKNFKGYVDSLNGGSKVEDVVSKFMKDYELENDPSVSNVEIMENSAIGEDLVSAISELKEGTAANKAIGEENSKVMYLFYKGKIADKVDEYIKDATNRKSVLQNYKGDEFNTYIESVANSLDIEISKAVSKYTPSMFEE